jgi:hypothetical protein
LLKCHSLHRYLESRSAWSSAAFFRIWKLLLKRQILGGKPGFLVSFQTERIFSIARSSRNSTVSIRSNVLPNHPAVCGFRQNKARYAYIVSMSPSLLLADLDVHEKEETEFVFPRRKKKKQPKFADFRQTCIHRQF